MAQILSGQSTAEKIGTGLGAGIGAGLNTLAQHKMNQINERHAQGAQEQKINELTKNWEMLNIAPEKARALANLPLSMQQKAFEELLPAFELFQNHKMPKEATNQKAQQQPIEQQAQQQQPAQQPAKALQFNQNPIDQLSRQALGPQAPQQAQQMSEPPSPLQEALAKNPQVLPKKVVPQQQLAPQEQIKPAAPLTAKQRKEKMIEKSLTSKQKAEERKEAIKEQHHADKETSKFYKEVLVGGKNADINDRRLDRMSKLVEKGNLTNPVFFSLLNTLEKGIAGFGVNLHSLENADSQEFNKISKEFLKEAKEIFGNRLTNVDIENFLKMIPDLSQSDDGKKRVIANMKAYNEGKKIIKRSMLDIIKENGGKRPFDLESQVDERSQAALDKLAQGFKEGYGSQTEEQKPPVEELSFLDRMRKSLGLII